MSGRGGAVVTASAPGKAFLIGELAALTGAPALVAAVDQRATVAARPGSEGGWRIAESPAGLERCIDPSVPAADPPTGDLVASAVRSLLRAGVELPAHLSLSTDSSALVAPDGTSLGLGSSAAVAVALIGALAPHLSPRRLRRLAIEAHRVFQGGRGSGYDAACSHAGGLVVCRDDGAGSVRVEPVALPRGLEVHLLTGGATVDTRAVIGRLESASSVEAVAGALTELDGLAREAIRAVEAGSSTALLDAVEVFRAAEARLGRALGVEIVTERGEAAATALRALGAACKPSGAGGDELLVALAPTGIGRRIDVAVARLGFTRLEAAVDPRGLVVAAS